jgi:hypothetical protein
VVEVKKMVPRPRKIVEKTYYYATDSDSEEEGDDHVARFVFPDGSDEEWSGSDSESESEATTVVFGEGDWELEESGSEVSDSEDGTDYESETEPESDSEELDEPKPYYGKGFRVYFDSTADKKFFMQAFGFLDA